jgi:hypothetical protein
MPIGDRRRGESTAAVNCRPPPRPLPPGRAGWAVLWAATAFWPGKVQQAATSCGPCPWAGIYRNAGLIFTFSRIPLFV